VIPIAFIVAFPPQANGIVGANYGNQCGGNSFYNGPGYMGAAPVAANNNLLPSDCGPLQEAIHYCQTQTKKKILLSLGGQSGGYGLNNAADGIYLADFLWGAYGPYNQTWVDNGGIRPLDRGGNNITTADTVDFDGFDFDIEQSSGGKSALYN
jgi:chitinase